MNKDTGEAWPGAVALNAQVRRLDDLNARVAHVLDAMRGGSALHLEYRYGAAFWRPTNGREVAPEVARPVIRHPNVHSVGDVLFVGMLAQTFRLAEET